MNCDSSNKPKDNDFDLDLETSPLALSPSITTTPSKLFPFPPKQISSICVPTVGTGSNLQLSNLNRLAHTGSAHQLSKSSAASTVQLSKSSRPIRAGLAHQLSRPSRPYSSSAGRGLKITSPAFRSIRNRVNVNSSSYYQDRKSVSVRTAFAQTVHIKKISRSTQTEVTYDKLKPFHLDKDITVIKSVNQGTQTPQSLMRPSIYRRRINLPQRQVINVNIRVPPKL